MLKPLLRTIPTLSGNVKLACFLTDYQKENIDNFSCYVRVAKLFPLSSVLSQRNIEANLLYSTYDYDLKKYFAYYSQYFYDDVFEYDKKNFIILDKTDSQKNRNTDFEFGCKRVSYQKNDTQFAFYAPIYVESLDDMPDAFNIYITLKNNFYNISKTIKVKIKEESKYNYLGIYFRKYLEQLDSNVVFCNTGTNQAVYSGIDLENGGFVKKLDNIIAKAFNKQNTINNFDAIISNGFQRNKLAIRQIFPFCFYFNVNDILNDDELRKLKNARVFIKGEWVKDGKSIPFYDIDMNYQYLYENPYLLNSKTGNFIYKKSTKNIMNLGYPSLNEAMYSGYRYSNKINLKYNRWKLKYSSDEHPYITNLSPAFSINQNSTYRYGTFPEKYYILNLITDVNNNVIVPIGNSAFVKSSPYYKDLNLLNNYYSIMNNNCSTWYSLVDDDNIYDKDIWKDTEDNKVYYNGILYNFSKIYDEYPEIKDKIDKFAVITKIHFNPLNENKLSDIKKVDTTLFTSEKYITDKTAWITDSLSKKINDGPEEFSKLSEFYLKADSIRNGNSQLVFDKIFIKNESNNGDFIDMLAEGYDIYELNVYYKYSDILRLLNKDENEELLSIFKLDETVSNFIEGFELIPAYTLNNLLHENNKDILFEKHDEAQWILDNLYFSQHGNYYKTPYDRDTVKSLIKEYGDDKYLIPFYIQQKFISKSNLISLLYEYYKDAYTSKFNYINENISKFEYHPRLKDDKSATYCADVFKKKDDCIGNHYGNNIPVDKKDDDVIYLDPYNMNNVIKAYNYKYKTSYPLISFTNSITTYAKFLNMKHLLYYISDLYKDVNNKEDLMELFNSLYIKKRVIYSNMDYETLDFKDQYIHISRLYNRYRPLTLEEKLNILDGQTVTIQIDNASKENLSNDISQYGTGIYLKTSDHYSGKSHILCKDVTDISDFNSNNDGYSFTISFNNNEYHDKDFYYIPTFYVRTGYADDLETNDNLFTELYTYIKDYIYNQDNSLYKYLTNKLISDLERYEVDDIDLNEIQVIGSRQSKKKLGFDTESEINKQELKTKLKKIKKILTQLIYSISDKVYYKNYIDYDPSIQNPVKYKYIKYNNYTGINDYVFLDNIYLKKELIKGNIDIPTYVINDEGEFIPLGYNEEEFCVLRNKNDEDYRLYIKSILSHFTTDIVFYEEDNYYKFSQNYLNHNDIDSIVGIPDLDGIYDSQFAFEVCYRKTFIRLDQTIFDLIHLDDSKQPYKDLYLYRFYKEDEYPSAIRFYYTNENIFNYEELSNCLYPLFNDIHLQDKIYSAIYSEYNQSNIYEVTRGSETNYRYNSTDIKYMLDISELDIDKSRFETYDIIDSCYSTYSYVCDDLNIYDKYGINTKTVLSTYSYTYTYSYTKSELYTDTNTSYTILNTYEGIGQNIGYNYITYGFVMIDGYCDNTQSSFNIVDTKYKSKKYFTYINESNIYNSFDLNTYFNLLVPFSKMNLYNNLLKYKDLIIAPRKYNITTYYKQTELYDDAQNVYAYNINYRTGKIDSITLQRYFDNIVPYIKETNVLYSTYCLKFKNYKYPNENITFNEDIFYPENINIYNYDKLKVYNSDNSYEMFEPIEYKFLNDSKLINLPEKFEIDIPGKYTYDELLELEKKENVIKTFKTYILKDGLNTFDDNQILFLYNRYKIIYDTNCIGLNLSKTDKIYTLKYKFSLL